MAATNLRNEFVKGATAPAGAACPFLFSSASWTAWHAGVHFGRLGAPLPRTVTPGRGSRVRVDGTLVTVRDDGSVAA